ncbi:unnamed protein product [Victoria cruziana]
MQPGYGIPELQQFMVDGSALFTLSNDLNQSSQQKHPHHIQLQQQQQQQQQQSRGYSYQHQFQPFLEFQSLQQPARWLHPPPPPSSPTPPPPPPPPSHLVLESQPDNPPSRLLPFISGFRPLVDTSEPGCSRERHHFPDEDASLADEAADRRWPREDGGGRSPPNSIRGPVWRLSDSVHNINSRAAAAAATTTNNNSSKRYRKGGEENEPPESKSSSTTSYRMFSELEAIYNVGFSGDLQAGSGSALTGDNPPPHMAKPSILPEMAAAQVDFASETSADEEGSLKKIQNVQQQQQQQKGKKKKRKKQQQKLASIAAFFERLVNQIMEHQEALHRRFMEVMERRDRERQSREEEWRRQEAARLSREKSLRAQEEAAAATREAAIVSFLEKITGETLRLPKREAGSHESGAHPEASETDRRNDGSEGGNNQNSNNSIRRWPKSEVNALIKVRSGLERRFQEPGLKGPLWEEVSSAMAAMGYERSAKRCKEKWENINKYFRKAKNTGKRRPGQRSKTCPYFHQLDLLYTGKASSGDENLAGGAPPARSELLDAIVPFDGGRKDKEAEPGSFGLVCRQTARKMGRNIKKLGRLNCGENDQNIDPDEDECGEEEDEEQEGDGDEEEEEDEEEEAEEEEDEEAEGAEEREGEKRKEEEKAQSASFMELVHNLTANSTGTTAATTFQDDDGGGGRRKNIDFSMHPSTSRLI